MEASSILTTDDRTKMHKKFTCLSRVVFQYVKIKILQFLKRYCLIFTR